MCQSARGGSCQTGIHSATARGVTHTHTQTYTKKNWYSEIMSWRVVIVLTWAVRCLSTNLITRTTKPQHCPELCVCVCAFIAWVLTDSCHKAWEPTDRAHRVCVFVLLYDGLSVCVCVRASGKKKRSVSASSLAVSYPGTMLYTHTLAQRCTLIAADGVC